ncbi:hypothetical protein BH18ACT9_BH18ACT9_14860 [soil metagenome]
MRHLDPSRRAPAVVRWTQRLETSSALDGPVRRLEPLAASLLANETRAQVLRGMWVGHAIHPVLTDIPIGTWTSATLLDLFGGEQSRAAARKLVGIGLLAAVPTAITGLAEWGPTETREKRVGVVHAMSNSVALGLYSGSWLARRRGRHARGAQLALAGMAASGAGAYLGTHLVGVRKVSSHHPAYNYAPLAR